MSILGLKGKQFQVQLNSIYESGIIDDETDRAVLLGFDRGGHQLWVPKSQMDILTLTVDGNLVEFEIAEWLADKIAKEINE